MNDESRDETTQARSPTLNGWRILGWVLLGGFLGAVLAAAFFAYGQPGLLLEQLNLRYCG